MKVNIKVELMNDNGKVLAVGDTIQIKTATLEGKGRIKKMLPKSFAVTMLEGSRLGQNVSGQSFQVVYKDVKELI